MAKIGKFLITALLIIMVAIIATGCATVGDQRVDLLYHRTEHATGGAGDLYLVVENAATPSGSTPVKWLLGATTDKDGNKLGNIVSDMAPEDLLMDALLQEFGAAGYHVVQDSSIPGEAKGLRLKTAIIKLEEMRGTFKVEAKCSMNIAVEPWLNGRAMKKLTYEADFADADIVSRDDLLSRTLLHGVQTIMARLVPEVINVIEPK